MFLHSKVQALEKRLLLLLNAVVCSRSSQGSMYSLGELGKVKFRGREWLPVVVSPPRPQEEQQDQSHHTDSHHSDVALLPVAGVAQLPPA